MRCGDHTQQLSIVTNNNNNNNNDDDDDDDDNDNDDNNNNNNDNDDDDDNDNDNDKDNDNNSKNSNNSGSLHFRSHVDDNDTHRVGSSVALSKAHTLSSSCCAWTEVTLINVRDPIALHLLPEPRSSPGCDRALFGELSECVYGLNFLGGFTSSRYMDADAGASSGWTFTYRRILHPFNLLKRPKALEAKELFRSSSLAWFTIIWVSPRYRRPPRVHLHRSENRMSLYPRQLSLRRVWRTSAKRCSSFLFGRFCAAHAALKKGSSRTDRSLVTFTAIFSGVTLTLTLFVLSSKVFHSRFCSTPNVILVSFVSPGRTCPCVSVWMPDGQTNISKYLQNFHT